MDFLGKIFAGSTAIGFFLILVGIAATVLIGLIGNFRDRDQTIYVPAFSIVDVGGKLDLTDEALARLLQNRMNSVSSRVLSAVSMAQVPGFPEDVRKGITSLAALEKIASAVGKDGKDKLELELEFQGVNLGAILNWFQKKLSPEPRQMTCMLVIECSGSDCTYRALADVSKLGLDSKTSQISAFSEESVWDAVELLAFEVYRQLAIHEMDASDTELTPAGKIREEVDRLDQAKTSWIGRVLEKRAQDTADKQPKGAAVSKA